MKGFPKLVHHCFLAEYLTANLPRERPPSYVNFAVFSRCFDLPGRSAALFSMPEHHVDGIIIKSVTSSPRVDILLLVDL